MWVRVEAVFADAEARGNPSARLVVQPAELAAPGRGTRAPPGSHRPFDRSPEGVAPRRRFLSDLSFDLSRRVWEMSCTAVAGTPLGSAVCANAVLARSLRLGGSRGLSLESTSFLGGRPGV